MGLLTLGKPLSWSETIDVCDYVKEHGIAQFINICNKLKGRSGDTLKWGDEIEYIIVKMDDEHEKVRVSLRGSEILNRLSAAEKVNHVAGVQNEFLWRPEYAGYMLEGTPGTPYGGLLACFNLVEANMRVRRAEARKILKADERLISIGNFPRLGCPDFTWPQSVPTPDNVDGVARSAFFPDDAIFNGHPRFANLTRNIRHRRGEKVAINVPIFHDEHTPRPFVEDFSKTVPSENVAEATAAALPDHIYMDAMGFGMGCCCLQTTFQAVNQGEARWLYDQLTPITPILLALSASTPIFRGYLSDVDSRWDVIAGSCDDRTREERGLEPLSKQKFRLNNSRYDSTNCYIYEPCSIPYNDIRACTPLPMTEWAALQYSAEHYAQLIAGGIDPTMARHVAHMFARDPLQVYKERIVQDDNKSTEHFETIQSSNWCNMRFKPPPPDAPEIGWRVEFRPTEVQLTDFENAAYTCFVVLLTRVIISFRLTFLIPISKVNENMRRAQKRDAVTEQKFWFRRGLQTCNSPPMDTDWGAAATPLNVSPREGAATEIDCTESQCQLPPDDDVVEMSIEEVICGKEGEFPGLIKLIKQYLDSADVDVDTRCTITQYLNFIQKRATGEIWTMAHWIRHFVRSHADYKKDSVVSEKINYDLIKSMVAIGDGVEHCQRLLGNFRSRTRDTVPIAIRKAEEAIIIGRAMRSNNK